VIRERSREESKETSENFPKEKLEVMSSPSIERARSTTITKVASKNPSGETDK
jgi:hypothetical protein